MPMLSKTATRRNLARDVHTEPRLLRSVRGAVHGGRQVRVDRRPRFLENPWHAAIEDWQATNHPGKAMIVKF